MVMDDQHLEKQQCNPLPLELGSLKALSVLGRGAKGVAFLVKSNNNNNNNSKKRSLLALKTVSKLSIKNKKKKQQDGEENEEEQEEEDPLRRIWIERDVLKLFDHPLFPKLSGVVVTNEIVGFAIDYCPGGNLKSLQKQQTENIFTHDIIRFYAAELVLALEYLHNLGVVYRDLKPENILIQQNGHLMLVDFDLSTKLSRDVFPITYIDGHYNETSQPTRRRRRGHWLSLVSCFSGLPSSKRIEAPPDSDNSASVSQANKNSKSNSFVGTTEYVAPEIILGNGHDFAVDWWSLGVVLYEMLYGTTPFRGDNRKETFYRILTKSPEMVGEQTPLRDLIRKLLVKDPSKRISLEGIKAHEFFQGIINWESILLISRPPFIPRLRWDEDEDDGVQDLEKGINVESYVQEVFATDKITETDTDSAKIKSKNENSKTVWVEDLHKPSISSNFQIF